MQRKAQLFLTALTCITAIACGPSSAGSPPSPSIPNEGSAELPKPILPGASSWKLQPSSADYFYSTISDAHLKLIDSLSANDESIISRTDFKFSSSRDARGFVISATINALSLQGGSRTGTSSTSFSLPILINGHLQNNELLFTLPGTSNTPDCTDPVFTALPALQRTLVIPPADLHTGMTWTDSTTANLCSAGIPVISGAIRNYRVLGESIVGTIPVILLEKHDRGLSTGEGSSGQHRVAIQTETVGSGQVAIDRLTGSLVDDVSTYTTSITIRSSGRNQRFTQTVKEHIALK
jgi:hypothetical protein